MSAKPSGPASVAAALAEEYASISLRFTMRNGLVEGDGKAAGASAQEGKKGSKAPAEGAASSSSSGEAGEGKGKKGGKEKAPKLSKEERKRQADAAAAAAAAASKGRVLDFAEIAANSAPYGIYPRLQSQVRTNRVWTPIKDLNADKAGMQVTVRARIHNSRAQAKGCFLVLRQGMYSLQACMFIGENNTTKEMIKFAAGLARESIVDVVGVVAKAKVESATQRDVELAVLNLYLVSASEPVLPLGIEDASRPEAPEDGAASGSAAAAAAADAPRVDPDTRLDQRVLDLRVPAHVAMFRIQSGVGQAFREFLIAQDFVEIHTPKIIGGASEGGAEVFRVKYFEGEAFLAQSPQLYKEMAVEGDLMRVFEVAPVFRAENSNTPRHLTEFIGLDVEMTIHEHYFEALDVLDALLVYIFTKVEERFPAELASIRAQYGGEPLKYNRNGPNLRLDFREGIRMLREAGVSDADPNADLTTPQEKKLGELVREKFDTDFYILHKYPLSARPFYTMPCPEDPNYSNSYDFMLRGQEIASGAQRVHEPELLIERLRARGVNPDPLRSYVDSTRYGGWPHAGLGLGLERLTGFIVGVMNVKKTSMFPRTPLRLSP